MRREVDLDALDVAQPALLQAGEAVRDHLGEHRNDALRQVNAGGPLARLAVQLAAGLDEMSHVGDVNGQAPVAGLLVARQADGVVEIAGVGRVDGDDRVLREVFAAVEVSFVKRLGRLPRFLKGRLGKHVGEAERADDREGVDAGLAIRPQHLDDNAFATVFRAGKAQHLEDDLVVRLRPLGARVADKDTVTEDGAVDADEAFSLALEVGADEMARGPLEDTEDAAGRRRVAVGWLA